MTTSAASSVSAPSTEAQLAFATQSSQDYVRTTLAMAELERKQKVADTIATFISKPAGKVAEQAKGMFQ
jgi:Skp family chaperone for outer membrane proteins